MAKSSKSQVKSKERVADHGEVFTNEREVNAMLDLVKQETERIDSRFLEPACGDGNFLAEILRRKLTIVDSRYSKNINDWERYSVIAVSSIYGVDILEDNAADCQKRLYTIWENRYKELFGNDIKTDCCRTIRYLLSRNILWGDALDFKNPQTKEPIVFSEWSPVNGVLIKRRDYIFKFLVEKTYQTSLFNDMGEPATIDEPVKDFPLIHYLKLGEDDSE
jgi:hypothetical protein